MRGPQLLPDQRTSRLGRKLPGTGSWQSRWLASCFDPLASRRRSAMGSKRCGDLLCCNEFGDPWPPQPSSPCPSRPNPNQADRIVCDQRSGKRQVAIGTTTGHLRGACWQGISGWNQPCPPATQRPRAAGVAGPRPMGGSRLESVASSACPRPRHRQALPAQVRPHRNPPRRPRPQARFPRAFRPPHLRTPHRS